MSIATKTKRKQHCRSRRRRRTSYHSGHQRWETLLPHTPTQLRLALSLARTTQTRYETETDFPIGVNCVDYFPSISDICKEIRSFHHHGKYVTSDSAEILSRWLQVQETYAWGGWWLIGSALVGEDCLLVA